MDISKIRTRRAVATIIGLALLAVVGCTNPGWPPGRTTTTRSTTTLPPTPGVTKGPAAGLPGYNVYRPTNLDAAGRKLPVITWANGGCYRSDFTWETIYNSWVLAGNVVVTMNAGPGQNPLQMSTAADQAKAIDWATAQNASGPLAGKLDLGKVVAAGNSCGGITSLQLASTDARVKAVFVLSGSSASPARRQPRRRRSWTRSRCPSASSSAVLRTWPGPTPAGTSTCSAPATPASSPSAPRPTT
jgi:predicted dienelactone hydrolase